MLEIPPIFKMLIGNPTLNFLSILFAKTLWKIGANGAPCPPFSRSFFLNS